MKFFISPRIKAGRISKWPVILGLIIVAGILGYLGVIVWRTYPEIFQKLPAVVLNLAEEEPTTEEIVQETPEIQISGEKKYVETAEQGEGITHLARKALKKYLQKKSQSFEVTPEHKIYIEDCIAKEIGAKWLNLGEELEISEDLIAEAIEKAETLTPEQLQNLTQYSQLVPSLNY